MTRRSTSCWPGSKSTRPASIRSRRDQRLTTDRDKLPGSRILYGRFTAVLQAIGNPKGRNAAAAYLREFVEDVKASGLVAKLMEKNGVRGLTVAPKPDGGDSRIAGAAIVRKSAPCDACSDS